MYTLLEDIKLEHPQFIFCDKYVDFKIRQVQHKEITITSVDVNILNSILTKSIRQHIEIKWIMPRMVLLKSSVV